MRVFFFEIAKLKRSSFKKRYAFTKKFFCIVEEGGECGREVEFDGQNGIEITE